MKKKVLFFIPSLEGGGAENVMVNILRQADKSKIEPVLILLDPFEHSPYRELLPEYVRVIVVGRNSDRSVEKIRQFINFVKTVHREKPKTILSMLTHSDIMAILAGMVFGIRVLICEHNTLGEVIKTREGKTMYGFLSPPW